MIAPETETPIPSVRKSYGTKSKAPVVIDGKLLSNTASAELQSQKAERIKKWEQSKPTPLPSAECPLAPSVIDEREKKVSARFFYNQRNIAKLPSQFNNWNQVARVLDLRAQTTANTFCDSSKATPAERILLYSRNHKCAHGRHFNSWRVDKSVVIPLCDHEYETITKIPGPPCHNCGRPTKKVDRICKCVVYSCTRCFSSMYPHQEVFKSEFFEDQLTTIYKNFDLHREVMFTFVINSIASLPTTVAPWAHLSPKSTPQMFQSPAPSYRYFRDLDKIEIEPPSPRSSLSAFSPCGAIASCGRSVFSKIKSVIKVFVDYISSLLSDTSSAIFSWLKENFVLRTFLSFIAEFLNFSLHYFNLDDPLRVIDIIMLGVSFPKYAIFRLFAPVFSSLLSAIYRNFPTLTGKTRYNETLGTRVPVTHPTKMEYVFLFIHSIYKDFSCTQILTSFIDAFKFFFSSDDSLPSPPPASNFSPPASSEKPSPLSSHPATQDDLGFYEAKRETDTPQSGFDVIRSLLKTATLFSKEFLPLFSLVNVSTTLLDKIPRLISKIFSYFSTTTQQWIECEISLPDSPLALFLDASYRYWTAFNSDNAKISSQYHYEGKRLGSAALS